MPTINMPPRHNRIGELPLPLEVGEIPGVMGAAGEPGRAVSSRGGPVGWRCVGTLSLVGPITGAGDFVACNVGSMGGIAVSDADRGGVADVGEMPKPASVAVGRAAGAEFS